MFRLVYFVVLHQVLRVSSQKTREDTLVLGPPTSLESVAGKLLRGREEVDDSDNSFCVVTRVYKPETPYLRSFLRHYGSLGVRKFYAFNNFYEEHDELLEIISNFSLPKEVVFELRSIPDEGDADALINSLGIDFITETFVISVDVDEFWVLPEGMKDLKQLVKHRVADHYQMPWVIVPNGKVQGYRRAPYDGLPGHAGKWMARRSAMAGLTAKTMHEPAMKPDQQWIRLGAGAYERWWTLKGASDVGNLVHFWGRSMQDMLLKQLVQRGMNRHASWVTGQLSGDWALPARLATLAFLESQRGPWIHIDPGHDLYEPDVELEARLTAQAMGHDIASEHQVTFARQLSSLQAAYEASRNLLNSTYTPILGLHPAKPTTPRLQELCHHGMATDIRSDCPHYPEWTVARLGGFLMKHLENKGFWSAAVDAEFGGSSAMASEAASNGIEATTDTATHETGALAAEPSWKARGTSVARYVRGTPKHVRKHEG